MNMRLRTTPGYWQLRNKMLDWIIIDGIVTGILLLKAYRAIRKWLYDEFFYD